MQTDKNKPLATLKGSGIQIDWANRIRADALRSLRDKLTHSQVYRRGVFKLNPAELPERIKLVVSDAEKHHAIETAVRQQIVECNNMLELLDRLGSETSAKWFIENKDLLNTRTLGKGLKCGFGGLFLQSLLNQKSA